MSKHYVVETFFELHNEEHQTKASPETCPICDVLTTETQQLYEDHLLVSVLDIVKKAMDTWDKRGYLIAQNTSPEVLSSSIVGKILDHPVVPKMIDIQLDANEIWMHPYVDQKIRELHR